MKYQGLRRVAQQDEWGCGVACVASILAWSYDRAKQELVAIKGAGINEKSPEGKGLQLHHLALALQKHSYHVVADWDPPKRWKPGSIVLVGVEGGQMSEEHYMLRVGGGQWMDPWINYPSEPRRAGWRKDFPSGKSFFVMLVPKMGSRPR